MPDDLQMNPVSSEDDAVVRPESQDDGFYRPEPEDDGFARPEGADSDAVQDGEAAVPARQSDPYVSWMLRVALSLIVVLLATTGALVYYLNTLNRAPRTSVERDVTTWETAVAETPRDANSWARLAYSYASAGRIDDALEAASEGKRRTKEPVFALVRADVLRIGGRYAEAKTAYDEAEKAVKDAVAEVKREREKLRIKFDIPDESLGRVYMGRALVQHELGEDKAAIKDLEEALKLEPQQSAMWVMLGDYSRGVGDTRRAKEAYENALKYIPDYAEALAGLEAIEKGAK